MSDNFEIIEQRKKGVPSYEQKYPDAALIAVNKTMFTVFAKAAKILGITDKCKILIAKKEGKFYIAKLDEISTRRGYVVSKRKNKDSFICCADSFTRHKYFNILFKVLDCEFIDGLDWYELEQINEQ